MTDVLVDYLATARRVLASPEGVYTLTPHEAVALAACTVRESTGAMPDLPRVAEAGPVFTASLAVAVQQLLSADAALLRTKIDVLNTGGTEPEFGDASRRLPDAVDAFQAAFNTLKTRFEKEFPNGSA